MREPVNLFHFGAGQPFSISFPICIANYELLYCRNRLNGFKIIVVKNNVGKKVLLNVGILKNNNHNTIVVDYTAVV